MKRPAPIARTVKVAPRAALPIAGARRRPKLEFEVEQARDPIAGMKAAPDDVEAQGEEILSLTVKAYRDSEAQQRAKYEAANSTAYYRVLVFDTPAQAEAFARAIGESADQQYIDGRKACDALKIEIPAAEWAPKKARPNPRLAAMALPAKR
jgi:hypothetical protein